MRFLFHNDGRLWPIIKHFCDHSTTSDEVDILSIFEQQDYVKITVHRYRDNSGFFEVFNHSCTLYGLDSPASRLESLVSNITKFVDDLGKSRQYMYYLTIDDTNSYYFSISNRLRELGTRIGVFAHGFWYTSVVFCIAHDMFLYNRHAERGFGRQHLSPNVYRSGLPHKAFNRDFRENIKKKYVQIKPSLIVAICGTWSTKLNFSYHLRTIVYELGVLRAVLTSRGYLPTRIKFIYRPHPYTTEDLTSTIEILRDALSGFDVYFHNRDLNELFEICDLAIFGTPSTAIYDFLAASIPIYDATRPRGFFHNFMYGPKRSLADVVDSALSDYSTLGAMLMTQYSIYGNDQPTGKLSMMSISASIRYRALNHSTKK